MHRYLALAPLAMLAACTSGPNFTPPAAPPPQAGYGEDGSGRAALSEAPYQRAGSGRVKPSRAPRCAM